MNKERYRQQYQWSNVFTMVRNLGLDPKICRDDFVDRLVVITGATSGIGYAAAHKYASNGADLVCINRDEQKSLNLCRSLAEQFGTDCSYVIADFTRLADVHEAGNQLASMGRTIDVLIHNAGVYVTQKTTTTDNLETVFQSNYLSAFILNEYVKEKLLHQNSGRILFVNSEAHRFAVWGLDLEDLGWDRRRYSGINSYAAAKTAQLLSMIILDDYFAGSGATVNAMHPGNIKTNSGQNNGRLYRVMKKLVIDRTARSPEVAAEALYYLGVSPELEGISGKFFNLTTMEEPAPPALDREAAEELWSISRELGGLT